MNALMSIHVAAGMIALATVATPRPALLPEEN